MRIPTLLVYRDDTLIEEPVDEELDSLPRIRFMPAVVAALVELSRVGHRLRGTDRPNQAPAVDSGRSLLR